MNELGKLLDNFQHLGGILHNVDVEYDQQKGFHLKVKNKQEEAIVFCPPSLLVDVEDVDIDDDGLYISNPDNYGENIHFLKKYFRFHFGKNMVQLFSDEWEQISQLSEKEKNILREIELYSILIHDMCGSRLAYAKERISGIHRYYEGDKRYLMPVLTFANHHPDGEPFSPVTGGPFAPVKDEIMKDGIMIRGKFGGEVYARYNFSDPLQLFGSYGYFGESEYAYSLPYEISKPDGGKIIIRRVIDESDTDEADIRWPVLQQDGVNIDISWFPLYYRKGPMFPVRIARMLSDKCGLPSDLIIYNIVKDNIQKLLEANMVLKVSKNTYAQSVVQAIDQQIHQIYGMAVG